MNVLKRHYLILVSILLFVILKLHGLGIRISDTNVYFYIGSELLQGKILYKDIFFTDLPLLPYIHSLYVVLVQNKLIGFYFTATIEVVICSLLIYKISWEQSKRSTPSAFVSVLFLFSFITLSVSDYQTGVFTASIFALLGYRNFMNKKLGWSGIMCACMVLSKAYYVPVVAVLGILILKKEKDQIIRFFVGFCGTLLFVLLPFLLLSRYQIYTDIVGYSLTRTQGVSKFNLILFFISHDILLSIFFLISVVRIRDKMFYGLLSLLSISIILLYSDPYYLYLSILSPFLCLSMNDVFVSIEHKSGLYKKLLYVFVIVNVSVNTLWYVNTFQNIGRIDNINQIVTDVLTEDPPMIYATASIGPAIAYLTKTPLLNNIVDTNLNIFRKKLLDSTILTNEAINQKAMIVSLGAIYPELGVNMPVTDEIFNIKLLNQKCPIIKSYPVQSEGWDNRITLLRCK